MEYIIVVVGIYLVLGRHDAESVKQRERIIQNRIKRHIAKAIRKHKHGN